MAESRRHERADCIGVAVMFHDELKNEFLAEFENSPSTLKLLRNVFIALEQSEERAGTDFCLFTIERIDEIVPSIVGIRKDSAEVILSHLRKYVRWCASRGIRVSNALDQFRLDLSQKVRSCYVRSPEHLKFVLDHVFGNLADNDIEYIYRSYLWLAYMGVEEEDAALITMHDLDFEKMTLTFRETQTQLYNESAEDLQNACSMTEFHEVKGSTLRVMPRAAGDQILRGKVSRKTLPESIETTFRQTVSKCFARIRDRQLADAHVPPDLLSVNLSYKRIYLSGIFYRAYDQEKLGHSPDFGAVAAAKYERNKHGYNHSQVWTDKKARYALSKGFSDDYESWKRAFNL